MRAMKDSGIPWIGEIPEGWNVCRVKDVALLYNGNSIKDEEKENYTNDTNAYPYISTKDIDAVYQTIDYTNGLYTKVDDSYFKIAHSGCSLMCIEGGSAGKKKAFVERSVSFVNKLCCFSPYRIEGKFLFHYLCSPNFEMEFNKYVTGLIGGVSVSTLKNFIALVPPLAEQQRIAEFLDRKCAEVDEMIALQEQIIEELKAYKQSVITEAVTKGLNPDAPMRDSGIEWIGSIPEHWEVRRIGSLFRLRDEKNYKPMGEVQLLSLYTGIGVFPHGEQEERGNKAVTTEGYKIVRKNDVVVNIILAWMGAIGVSNYDGVTSPAYDVYIPNHNAAPHYYHYVFRTKGIAAECYKYGRGIMMMRWRTYSSEFKQIHIPYPNIAEQQAIADYLDEKCADIDSLIQTKQSKIDSLKEYKKSIIYEYVTGKREVNE